MNATSDRRPLKMLSWDVEVLSLRKYGYWVAKPLAIAFASTPLSSVVVNCRPFPAGVADATVMLSSCGAVYGLVRLPWMESRTCLANLSECARLTCKVPQVSLFPDFDVAESGAV